MIRVNKGCQVYREILASKETRGVMACQGSQVPGGSQGLWAKLGTKAHLVFLDLLVPRVSQEILAPQGTMALKAQRVSLEPEAYLDLLGSWGLREMKDPWGHQESQAWRVNLEGRGFRGGLAWMARRGNQGILDDQGLWVNRGLWDLLVWLESLELLERRETVE